MRAPLRFQELEQEVGQWCAEHNADYTSEFTVDDEEVPAFMVTLKKDGRKMHFRLVKGWPVIIEVRRDDFPDDDRALRLLKVNNDNSWNPNLHCLLDPWAGGRPFETIHPPLRFQELQREINTWCEEHRLACEQEFANGNTFAPDLIVRSPQDNRSIRFHPLKAWPVVVKVQRSDLEDPRERECLLKVDEHSQWTPPLYKLLDPWKAGRPFEG